MTVGELKRALRKFGKEFDNCEFRIWLPGSEIYIAAPGTSSPTPFERNGKLYLEGNVTGLLADVTAGLDR